MAFYVVMWPLVGTFLSKIYSRSWHCFINASLTEESYKHWRRIPRLVALYILLTQKALHLVVDGCPINPRISRDFYLSTSRRKASEIEAPLEKVKTINSNIFVKPLRRSSSTPTTVKWTTRNRHLRSHVGFYSPWRRNKWCQSQGGAAASRMNGKGVC